MVCHPTSHQEEPGTCHSLTYSTCRSMFISTINDAALPTAHSIFEGCSVCTANFPACCVLFLACKIYNALTICFLVCRFPLGSACRVAAAARWHHGGVLPACAGQHEHSSATQCETASAHRCEHTVIATNIRVYINQKHNMRREFAQQLALEWDDHATKVRTWSTHAAQPYCSCPRCRNDVDGTRWSLPCRLRHR